MGRESEGNGWERENERRGREMKGNSWVSGISFPTLAVLTPTTNVVNKDGKDLQGQGHGLDLQGQGQKLDL